MSEKFDKKMNKKIKRALDKWSSVTVVRSVYDHKGKAIGNVQEEYHEMNNICSWGVDNRMYLCIGNKDGTAEFSLEVSLKTAKRMLADLKDLIECVES